MKKIFSIIILIFLFSITVLSPAIVFAEKLGGEKKFEVNVAYGGSGTSSKEMLESLKSTTTETGVDPSGTTATGSSGGSIPLPSDKPANLPTNISVSGVIQTVFNAIVSVGEVAFIIMLLVGGVMYITSGGEESATKARKLIINAIIGIVILLSAWAIATWVLHTLGAGG